MTLCGAPVGRGSDLMPVDPGVPTYTPPKKAKGASTSAAFKPRRPTPAVPGIVKSPVEDPYATWARSHHDQHGAAITVKAIKKDVRRGKVSQPRAAAALHAIGQ